MKRLILVGGGHAHLHVLEHLASNRPLDTEVVLVSPERWQYYSGMLPGWIAGQYDWSECRIDLRPLAKAARVRFVEQPVVGMNAQRRCICLNSGEHLYYDLLSLDVGSETDDAWLCGLGQRLMTIKPLERFKRQWHELIEMAPLRNEFQLAVVGGGAAGVEVALGARHAFNRHAIDAKVTLITGESGLLSDLAEGARKCVTRALKRAAITVVARHSVGTEDGLLLSNGDTLLADKVIAATGSRAHAWLSLSKLELDDAGYVSIDPYHRSISHPEVFAAGDVCSRTDISLARSGISAVHAGPVLAHNLLAALRQAPLEPYQPRRRQLRLLACGERRAIASWGSLCAEGRWVWNWKDAIDRRFISRFSPATGSVG